MLFASSDIAAVFAAMLEGPIFTKHTQSGPGRRTTKHVSKGPAKILYRTRQIERAEGLASLKKQSTMFKLRLRERAGKALSTRAGERETRELTRRDARFDVHTMIERSRGAGRL